jgi:hypothetical protein
MNFIAVKIGYSMGFIKPNEKCFEVLSRKKQTLKSAKHKEAGK